ncbi:MarR family winged helix-turn-helix transcriptional regulator [Aurantiacibacter suaedae]|uniref:MarR family winged helix-turn-helix transcriptional regulator n=1 Tax=Aurantiacibacter suaedae TaxID=2545755 RepID=UPI0010F8E014|nr:MarR family transcriptional regulator [Aurantiacibacter suaedae]
MTAADHSFDQANAPQALSDRLIMACEAVVRCRAASFRQSFGLTEIHYRLLAQVNAHAPITLATLAANLSRDCGQISRMVKMLTTRGLIARPTTPAPRPLAIRLTPMGRTICEAMSRIAQDSEQAIAALLPEEDKVQASLAVERIYCAARTVLEEERLEPV